MSVLAKLSLAEAAIASQLCEHKAQLSSCETAMLRYRVVGDPFGVAVAQNLAGHALIQLGRSTEAKAILQEALAAVRRLGNHRFAASVLGNLAGCHIEDGDFFTARAYLIEALQVSEALGSKLTAGITLEMLSECEFRAGAAELALQHATEALAAFHSINGVRHITEVRHLMAVYLISLDRYDDAEECAREMLDLAREERHHVFAAQALQHIGAIAALRPQIIAVGTLACSRSARILGFVDARFTALRFRREDFVQQEYDRALAVLRDAMGADAVANLMADGAAMTEDQALEALTI